MGYRFKTINKERQEAPFLILEKNIYENLNVGTLAEVIDTYEGGVKLKSIPKGEYFDSKYSLVEYDKDTTKITYSKGDKVLILILDNYGTEKLTDNTQHIMHDYKNAVILGKAEDIVTLNDKGNPDLLLDVPYSDFTDIGNNYKTRTFTQEEIDFLYSTSLAGIKVTGIYFDDTVSVLPENNYIILKRVANQKGIFGITESPINIDSLYYEGSASIFGMLLKVILILDNISKVGTCVVALNLTTLSVNDRTFNGSYYIPTNLGSQGQVPVSTGNGSNPFTYEDYYTRVTGPVAFYGSGRSNTSLGSLIKEHPTIKLYYESTSGSVKTVYNLNYKCEYDESTQTYTVEIYYFDGGSLVQLTPPSNSSYTLNYEYFE